VTFPKSFFLVSSILVLSLLIGCTKSDPNTVAKVGDWTLTTDEFRDIVTSRYGTEERAAEKSFEELSDFLDELLVQQLQIKDAYNRGFDTDPEVVMEYDDAVKRAAIAQLYKKEIRDAVVTEADVKAFYQHDKEEIHASHILLMAENDVQAKSVKKKIDRIRAQAMMPGNDFGELAKKNTEDKSSPDGDLGWFRWGTMVEEFQQVAFNLKPGEISEPVKTQFGWHIIQLHGRRDNSEVEPFEQAKERIIAMVSRQRQKELGETAENYIKKLKEDRKYSFDKGKAGDILKIMSSKTNTGDPLSLFNAEQKRIIIATLDDGATKITANELLEKMGKVNPSGRGMETVDKLSDFCDRMLVEDFLLPQKAKETGCFSNPEVAEIAEEARKSKLKRIVQDMMVKDRVNPTDEEAKEYFDNHTVDFMSDAQFTLIEILVASEDLAKELYNKVKKGGDIRQLAIEHSERKSAKKKEGVLGPISSKRYKEIGKAAAQAEVGELVGPIYVAKRKKWSVFKVISKEEAKPQNFTKVKRKVLTKLRKEKRQELEAVWTDSLKSNIKHTLNTKPLKTLYADIKTPEQAEPDEAKKGKEE